MLLRTRRENGLSLRSNHVLQSGDTDCWKVRVGPERRQPDERVAAVDICTKIARLFIFSTVAKRMRLDHLLFCRALPLWHMEDGVFSSAHPSCKSLPVELTSGSGVGPEFHIPC